MSMPGEGNDSRLRLARSSLEASVGQLGARHYVDVNYDTAPDGAIGIPATALRSLVSQASTGDIIWISGLTTESNPAADITALEDGKVIIDHDRRDLLIEGDQRRITKGEFNVLECLARRLGLPTTRYDIMRYTFGNTDYRDPRVIDVHVNHLRRAFGEDYKYLLATKRGVGYLLRRQLPVDRSDDAMSA